VTCLRSVLMKPEHEAWWDRIWERAGPRAATRLEGKLAQRPSAMRNSRRNPLLFQETSRRRKRLARPGRGIWRVSLYLGQVGRHLRPETVMVIVLDLTSGWLL